MRVCANGSSLSQLMVIGFGGIGIGFNLLVLWLLVFIICTTLLHSTLLHSTLLAILHLLLLYFTLLIFAFCPLCNPLQFTFHFSPLFSFYVNSSVIAVISLHIQVLVLVPFARFLLHTYIHCSTVAFTWIFQYRCYCCRCCTFFGSISNLLKVLEFGTLGDLGLGQSKFHFFQKSHLKLLGDRT